jgi:membrane-bound lytic murein transglycosylase A
MRVLLQRLAVAVLLASSLHACAPTPEPNRIRLSAADFSNLPGWSDGAQQDALPALKRSCAALMRRADDASVGPGAIGGTVADWRAPCAAIEPPPADAAAARQAIERTFRPWRVTDGAGYADGLFTGYYEAELHGARQRSARYHVPILARPSDLVTVDLGKFAPDLAGKRIAGRVVKGTLQPYPTRAAIERGALAGRGLEIAWVDDPADAFFLHIQGSGRIVLDDGSVLRVGYAAANGRPYTPIGRVLIADGAVPRDKMSMQAIRAWIDSHPAKARALMDRNASYIFFHVLKGDGPLGAEGVALTPGRSLAVDTRLMPLGAPVWLDTTDPLDPKKALRRLMVAQDTGGAIRGAVRGDFFWGYGPDAAARAGKMKQTGRYFLLLPRTVQPMRPTS